MFIKFEGRLIQLNQVNYAEKRISMISPSIRINFKNEYLDILYKNTTTRDSAYSELEKMVVK